MRVNKNYDVENLPIVTKRIKQVIDEKFNGNTRQFCLGMGLTNSAKVNRLFILDKRSGNYPVPSSDILLMISNTYNVSIDWLMKGIENTDETHVNNINIVSGEGNVTANGDNTVNANNEYIDIIKKQQEQIESLMKILSQKM